MSSPVPSNSNDHAAPFERVASILVRVGVWVTLFSALYFLRSFFLLIFLTFVFAYIQANGVERLSGKIKSRTLRAVFVALILLSLIIAIGAFIVPPVREQTLLFADRYPRYLQTIDEGILSLSKRYSLLRETLPHHDIGTPLDSSGHIEGWDPRSSPAASIIQSLFGLGEGKIDSQSVMGTISTLRNVGGYLLGIGSAFLLSLLFSFLIVLDLPNLARATVSLRETKLKFIYDEVAESIFTFSQTLGRALEAQLFIAILNTALTGIALWFLGFGEKMAFLLVIVFLCSFIPVAGVFISSVPICLVALQESGFSLMLGCIAMITVVHMIEAYILNPKIYGHHLRMNPVIVLIILTMGGKIFHVWGLVLGVPVCTYIFDKAIRYSKTGGTDGEKA